MKKRCKFWSFQQAIRRPKTPKPKDPDDYNFDDPDLERDYRKMYDTLQEMEAKEKARQEQEQSNDDPNIVKEAMEAALIFGGAK